MKQSLTKRLLSVVLVLALVCGLAVPASAVSATTNSHSQNLNFQKVEGNGVDKAHPDKAETVEKIEHQPNDVVRVSIILEKKATLSAGFSSESVAANAAAMNYRDSLKADQNKVSAAIEKATGEKLDIAWNLTLAANLISANVKFAQIAAIEKVAGVKEVVIENRYEPQKATASDEPNMGTSCFMIGSNVVWANGYTGAGSKVAVIDTGIDIDHQSFNAEAYNFAMGLNAEKLGMTLDEYKAHVGVLTVADVAAVADQLNINKADFNHHINGFTAEDAYLSDKIPFAANYIDANFTVDHDHDSQGEHGSHVEGIAAANRFIPNAEGGFTAALESVMTQGVAPDAQIVTMKVFGAGGGAYDSDYMAAIEDAIVLGCDSANLSLGSGNAGFAFSGSYQAIMDSLTECSTVVAMSAGNSGGWNDTPYGNMPGYLYKDDVSMDTAGSPGSFTNSLGVASVNNSGNAGMPLMFGDIVSFYTETTGYTNPPIASTIPGENTFIFFNNTAVDGDGNDLLAAYAEDIAGKVVLVYRGSSSFYQKMDAAAAAGATACIIVNNQAGTINMDLSSATSEIPCVSITQADGEKIKAAYEISTLSDGTEVWTGTFTVTDTVQAVPGDSDFYTISDFSSWGVPGSLTMKPEISAPGGSIYSVNGAIEGGKGYELMSGTSMASPQVAGMAAIMGQYIRDNDLTTKTGLTARQLTNSLLMATAVPMLEDWGEYGFGYYPILRQGSGLANVGNATTAKAYIMMAASATASAADGKVKVELGDDPNRTGAYSWAFSINNFSGETITYTLSTDLFTQDLTSDGTHIYMDTWTALLNADVTYTVNGVEFVPVFAIDADVNNDGKTDAADAQAILEYVVGNLTAEQIDTDVADIDEDGKITSADAYALLKLSKTSSFEVPANGKVDVVVNAAIAEDDKEFLDHYYEGGAYIEGYTYVTAVTDEEGSVTDVEYSIPVLGFYGSWTDASMFDNTSIVDVTYGTNDKVPYTGNTNTNGLFLHYGNDTTNYWFLGNPYLVEDEFPVDRLAVGNDVTLYQFRYNLIRNAAAIAPAITDENGKVLWLGNISNDVIGAYYYTNGSAWRNTATTGSTVNKAIASLNLAEGSKITIGLYAVPEYYANPENGKLNADEMKAVIESGVLGDGASISYTVVVDNTAPVVTGITKDLITGDLTVTAQDDNYIAAVMIMNGSGSKVLGSSLPEQDAPNQSCSTKVELDGANPGSKALIVVADYAGNETTYEVEYSAEPVSYEGKMYGFTQSTSRGNGDRWVEINPDTVWYNSSTGAGEGVDTVSTSPVNVLAAEYVDGYVFMAGEDYIYVAPQGEWDAIQKVGKISETIVELAYNYADSQLYAVTSDKALFTVDMITGAMTKVADLTGSATDVRAFTIDDEGNMYFINRGKELFKFTVEDVVEDAISMTKIATIKPSSGSMYLTVVSSAAYDHDANKLYLAASYNLAGDYDNKLWVVDTETGAASLANPSYRADDTASSARPSSLQVHISGLYIVPSADKVPPVTAPTLVELNKSSVEMMKGTSATLVADVYPWKLADKSVTWTSSDPSIVSVEDGVIEALAVGTATITVTTVATPALSASCEVTVVPVPVAAMSGLIYAVDGATNWSDFTSDAPQNATIVASGDAYYGGVLVGDTLYTVTEDTLFAVDADTFEATSLGGISADWIYADGAPVPEDLFEVYGGKVVAPCYGGTYLEVLDPEKGSLSYWSGIASYYADDPMAVIALVGRVTYEGDENALLYYVLTENGELWAFTLYNEEYLSREDLGNVGLKLGNVSAVTAGVYASMIYDQATGFLFVASYVEGENAQMYAINPETLQAVQTGEFGEGVWPAVALYQYTRVTELTLKLSAASRTMFVGGTFTLGAKVKPAAYTGGVTFTSDNTAVATVDENGVITAVAPGTAIITVTTVDTNEQGEHLSATCEITVQGKATVNAHINGLIGSNYVDIDLNDLSTTTTGTAYVPYDAGGVAGGEKYGMYGNYFVIDASHGAYNFASYPNYIALDMANFPAISENNPTAVLYPSSTNYLVLFDAVNGSISSWNLSSSGMNLVAATYIGSDADDDGVNNLYYMLSADGTLRLFFVYENGENLSIYPTEIANLGMTFEPGAVSMTYVWDGTEEGIEGLVISDKETMNLYWVDLTADELAVAILGTVEGDAICSLYNTTWDNVTTGANANSAILQKAMRSKSTAAMGLSLNALTAETVSLKSTNAVVGGTNAVSGTAKGERLAHVNMVGTPVAEDGEVTITVTEDMDVTNGMITVTYDADTLTFVTVNSNVSNLAVNASEAGKIVLAYADLNGIAAEDAIATLKFTYAGETVDTTVTLETNERNEDVAVEEDAVNVHVLVEAEAVEDPAVVKSANLVLEGQILVNIKVEIPEALANAEGAYATMDIDGYVSTGKTVLLKDAVSVDGVYTFTMPVAIMELNDAITLKLFDGEGNQYKLVKGASKTELEDNAFVYSAADYLNTKKNSSNDAALADLSQKLLDFGAAAQVYFGYEADSAVVPDLSGVTAETLAQYKNVISGSVPGMKIASATLALDSVTTIRVKLQATAADADINDYTVTCNGKPVTLIEEDGKYVVEISNIFANALDEAYEVVLSDAEGNTQTLSYSALSFAYSKINKDQVTHDLVAAMYLYNQAANVKFG